MNNKIRELLTKVAEMRAEGCTTVTLTTHRTGPDNLKDPILLKALLKQAENRLKEKGVKDAPVIMSKLTAIAGSIDHAHNLEGLVIFANSEFSDHVKLPVAVVDRVTVDGRFATRDLFRALQQEAEYYVLSLDRDVARLFLAFNGKLVEEVRSGFPMRNTVARSDAAKQVVDRDHGALIKEFFNKVDKALLKVLNERPFPVVLATVGRNVEHYRAIADKWEFIKAQFSPTREDLTPHHLVEEAWEAFSKVVTALYNTRVEVLERAISAGRLFSDPNDIWRAVNEGKGGTIFVKQGLFQPALMSNGLIELLPETGREKKGAVDDIIDEMIERNKAFGGDAVFVNDDALDQFHGLALVTRY